MTAAAERETQYVEVGGRVVARWWRENESGSHLPDVWRADLRYLSIVQGKRV